MIEQDPVGAAIEAMAKSPLPDSPEFICPSCMWQGDRPEHHGCECPRCQDELMDRKEYDRNEANNAHDDDLEERRLSYD